MNKHNTIFGQLLGFVNRPRFNKLANEYQTDKGSKGFSSWAHFASMLFGQLSGQSGLRSIENGINGQGSSLYHLGIPNNVKRSTISYANRNRNSLLFERLFYEILGDVQENKPKHGFKFKNPLYSIDATTIDLCLNLFPWAEFRENKGGIKISVKLDHRGKIPCFVVMSNAIEHETKAIPKIPLNAGDIVAFDRGYNDYGYFATLCNKEIYFVTRMKSNAKYNVISTNSANHDRGIISDEIIELSGFYSKKDCPHYLRKIVSIDPEMEKTITILTNHLEWAPTTIASIYKDRWQIELFFKAIKQNLKIKRFYGTSRNAVYTQIWIALITYLLHCHLRFISKAKQSFTNFMSVLPTVLFQRRSIWDWFFEKSPPGNNPAIDPLQLELI